MTKNPYLHKIKRLTIYFGYGDNGQARLDLIEREAKRRKTSKRGIIVNALRKYLNNPDF